MNRFAYFSLLMEKYFNGSLDSEERTELISMLRDNSRLQRIFVEYSTQESALRNIMTGRREGAAPSSVLLRRKLKRGKQVRFVWAWVGAAASLALVAGFIFISSHIHLPANPDYVVHQSPEVIPPPQGKSSGGVRPDASDGNRGGDKSGGQRTPGDGWPSVYGTGQGSAHGKKGGADPGAGMEGGVHPPGSETGMIGAGFGGDNGKEPLFSDDFTSYTEGAVPSKLFVSGRGKAAVELIDKKNALHIYPECTVSIGSTSWDDYSVKAECRIPDRQEGGFSVHIRTADAQDFYSLRLLPSGKKAVLYRSGETDTKKLKSVSLDADLHSWFSLCAKAAGRNLSFSVNGTELISVDSADLNKGYVQIRASDSAGLFIRTIAITGLE